MEFKGLLQIIRELWYAEMRRADLSVLWPTCVRVAEDIKLARALFSLHVFNDEAWLFLGREKIVQIIDELE